jgi:hypothetical protein
MISSITLALDFAVTLFIPANVLDVWLIARDRNDLAYDNSVAWHHDLKPNVDMQRLWGPAHFPFKTDADGFRTGRCADGPPIPGKTALVIGDSFVEGLGLKFEDTVAGLIACAWSGRGVAVRSLGVASYSPIIYHRKIADAVRRLGVKPAEVVVFVDVCDPHDEVFQYREENGRVVNARRSRAKDVRTWLRHNSMAFALLFELRQRVQISSPDMRDIVDRPCARWTRDASAREEWADRGLASAAANLEKIVAQCREWGCRLSLVVYPWPDQVVEGEPNSLQVSYWRAWAERHGVLFIDGFAPFFVDPPAETIRRYYISGDIHFNEAGNAKLFEQVWRSLRGP